MFDKICERLAATHTYIHITTTADGGRHFVGAAFYLLSCRLLSERNVRAVCELNNIFSTFLCRSLSKFFVPHCARSSNTYLIDIFVIQLNAHLHIVNFLLYTLSVYVRFVSNVQVTLFTFLTFIENFTWPINPSA